MDRRPDPDPWTGQPASHLRPPKAFSFPRTTAPPAAPTTACPPRRWPPGPPATRNLPIAIDGSVEQRHQYVHAAACRPSRQPARPPARPPAPSRRSSRRHDWAAASCAAGRVPAATRSAPADAWLPSRGKRRHLCANSIIGGSSSSSSNEYIFLRSVACHCHCHSLCHASWVHPSARGGRRDAINQREDTIFCAPSAALSPTDSIQLIEFCSHTTGTSDLQYLVIVNYAMQHRLNRPVIHLIISHARGRSQDRCLGACGAVWQGPNQTLFFQLKFG